MSTDDNGMNMIILQTFNLVRGVNVKVAGRSIIDAESQVATLEFDVFQSSLNDVFINEFINLFHREYEDLTVLVFSMVDTVILFFYALGLVVICLL